MLSLFLLFGRKQRSSPLSLRCLEIGFLILKRNSELKRQMRRRIRIQRTTAHNPKRRVKSLNNNPEV